MDGNGAGAMSFFLASTLEDGSVGFSTRRLVGRLDMPRHFPLSSIADEAPTNPLLKFHGCFLREPEETLWTQAQLHGADPGPSAELLCMDGLNLPAKDLLIVGF
jgi:hypothetical protein